MPPKKKTEPFSYDTTYTKAETPLTCTKKSDSLQLVLATAKGKPGHGGMFQKSDYCSVAPNRCFRKLCEFEGQTVPVFSAVVSDLADLPKPELWQSMDFDGQTVLFDKYSIALTLGSGCVVKKWVPEGMDETQPEICGIELHFVENADDDFVPMSVYFSNCPSGVSLTRLVGAERIAEIAERHRQHAIKAHDEIQGMHSTK